MSSGRRLHVVPGGKRRAPVPRIVDTEGEAIEMGIGEVPREVVPLLVEGRRYRGQWIVRGQVSALVTPTDAAGLVEDIGFSGVKTFRTAAELPPDWPKDRRSLMTATIDHWSFFFEGYAARTVADLPRPEALLSIWDAKDDRAPGEAVVLPEVTISPRMMIAGQPLWVWAAVAAGVGVAGYVIYRHYEGGR